MGQVTIDEYLEGRKTMEILHSGECVCKKCLYYWSYRCPYGGRCYDDHRAETDPYDRVHPDKPPRTGWSNWKTDQAYWCRGGIFHPVYYCRHFVKYKGQQVRSCLKENVSVFQDGYILCSMAEYTGVPEVL